MRNAHEVAGAAPGLAHPHRRRNASAMQAIVRPSRASDIPALTAIYGHAVRLGSASFEIEPPDEAEMARRREAILAAGYPHLVAERDNEVAGYAYVSAFRTRPAYRFTVENSVYVAPNRQRERIGHTLLAALISQCEAAGFRLMVAVIGDSANHASIGLHASHGFNPAGLLPSVGWKHGRWLDCVLMTRPLGDGARFPPPPNR
jgi:phosphinothricin acetyltransferase